LVSVYQLSRIDPCLPGNARTCAVADTGTVSDRYLFDNEDISRHQTPFGAIRIHSLSCERSQARIDSLEEPLEGGFGRHLCAAGKELTMEEGDGFAGELDADRLRLLKAKLGILLNWKPPKLVPSIGPFQPEVFERFDKEVQEIVEKCKAALTQYSDEQIAEIRKGIRDGGVIARQWSDLQSNDIYHLTRRLPEWHDGGFGHPDHAADFAYWTRMPSFELNELTCLSVGISPTEFSTRELTSLTRSKDRAKFSKPIEFLVLRFELFQRNFDPHSHEARTTPRRFITWVDDFGVEVHPGFLEPLRALHSKPEVPEAAPSAAKTDKREIDTIAQLFTAMAIDQLGFNPRAARSQTAKEISDLAASYGMRVTDETVRKYLRLGAKYIADDWVPPGR
jgi:hypothetical protein